MKPILEDIPLSVMGLTFVALLLGALEISYHIGLRRAGKRDPNQAPRSSNEAIPAAMLGLLGLLLAFTYSFTVSRSNARKEAILNEINAIGTSFHRADLLDEPLRSNYRTTLIDFAHTLPVQREDALRGQIDSTLARMKDAQSRMWPVVRTIGNQAQLGPYETAFIASVNEVHDAHTARITLAFERLSLTIKAMLLFVACASMAVAGYASGKRQDLPRGRMTALALSISAVMFTVTDFDRPLEGFIQSNQQGFLELVSDMESEMDVKAP